MIGLDSLLEAVEGEEKDVINAVLNDPTFAGRILQAVREGDPQLLVTMMAHYLDDLEVC